MRLPIGTRDVSASGGTVELVGRRGEGWAPVSSGELSLAEAVTLLAEEVPETVDAAAPDAPRFSPGEVVLWNYRRVVEVARVIRDDEHALVVWIPSGSGRLESAPADGRRTREVSLEERFTVPWVMAESTWQGPGLVRVAPHGKPWSVWFFRDPDGGPGGVYVNLELPHRRAAATGDEPARTFSRDLVLDLWLSLENPGSEDVWLKDADELDAAVTQGRYSAEQREAIRTIADAVSREVLAPWGRPLAEGWESWLPARSSRRGGGRWRRGGRAGFRPPPWTSPCRCPTLRRCERTGRARGSGTPTADRHRRAVDPTMAVVRSMIHAR
ncbi:DUF402 domain-containing protein [Microbacterium gorillae]|uniref:DUF402 domain-containing protein n=1 Tax=Microbacterium gorillae TaxID=1231063 RepID=UPI000693B055|nr:DUF402 domain-containing protein [Microbacterium gorillae]